MVAVTGLTSSWDPPAQKITPRSFSRVAPAIKRQTDPSWFAFVRPFIRTRGTSGRGLGHTPSSVVKMENRGSRRLCSLALVAEGSRVSGTEAPRSSCQLWPILAGNTAPPGQHLLPTLDHLSAYSLCLENHPSAPAGMFRGWRASPLGLNKLCREVPHSNMSHCHVLLGPDQAS